MAYELPGRLGLIAALLLLSANSGLCYAEVLTITGSADAISLTGGYCAKNISVKYQVPVTRICAVRHIVNVGDDEEEQQQQQRSGNSNTLQQHVNNESGGSGGGGGGSTTNAPSPLTIAALLHSDNGANGSDNDHHNNNNNNNSSDTEEYVEFEERVRWDTVHVCCPGYRSLLFGFCTPICTLPCPLFSYCSAPDKCECLRGYEPSHHPNKQHQLICRPVCVGGCPEHSQCVARNSCECRPGYKAMSAWWFQPLRCERIQCPAADQRYDVERRNCVKIEMSMEELMQRVAEKLARGLNATSNSYDDDDDDDADNYTNEDKAANVGSDVPAVFSVANALPHATAR